MLKFNHVMKRDISMDDLYQNINYIDDSNISNFNKWNSNNPAYSKEDLLNKIGSKFIECNRIILNHQDGERQDQDIRYAAFLIDLKGMNEFELVVKPNAFEFNKEDEGYYPMKGRVGSIVGIFNVNKTYLA